MYPNLKIKKRFGSLTAVSGTIKLDKKSYYKFRDKKLRLRRGLITFKGKSSTPYLNIVMYYRGKDYTININVSGTPARPVLYFSSNPPLSKDQILAYLLFDDSSAAGTHSQQAMLNLIGGTLAKSFFGAIGIKIDHISIKENGFSIGKSINDKVTIYYNQSGDKPSIKTRIDITKSVHTDIEVGEDSQSADIIFSKEY
jgi:translocation and assembly module TamB